MFLREYLTKYTKEELLDQAEFEIKNAQTSKTDLIIVVLCRGNA